MQTKNKTKTKFALTTAQINAVAHNILIEEVLQTAWDFVNSLGDEAQFDYAFTNTSSEDYMDTTWHTTQNVKMYYSMLQQDSEDMYNNAKDLFVSNFVGVNLADLTAEEVYATLDDISGDTAMREEYYGTLREHFKQFANNNKHFELQETEYKGCYKLVCVITAKQKAKLVRDYIGNYGNYTYTQDEIVLNNEIA